jgi:hypothetical protein
VKEMREAHNRRRLHHGRGGMMAIQSKQVELSPMSELVDAAIQAAATFLPNSRRHRDRSGSGCVPLVTYNLPYR